MNIKKIKNIKNLKCDDSETDKGTIDINEKDEKSLKEKLDLIDLNSEENIIILSDINNNDLSDMFCDCKNLSEIRIDINNLKIENISNMFKNCISLYIILILQI